MTSLSPATWEIIQWFFPSDQWEEAGRILAEQCGQNLPLLEKKDAVGLERVRFAALKLSQGDMQLLRKSVELGTTDWRDLLMAADFGHSTAAHREWYRELAGR
jgi:hypothetical protein